MIRLNINIQSLLSEIFHGHFCEILDFKSETTYRNDPNDTNDYMIPTISGSIKLKKKKYAKNK